MNKVRDIVKLIKTERDAGIEYGPASWHWPYRRSPYIFIANLDLRLSEGDMIIIFSQFGEVVDCKLVRDKKTGDSRGFGYIAYEDPRSKVLAIEGMCGTEILGRTIFVDHGSKHKNGENQTKIGSLNQLLTSDPNLIPKQQGSSGLAALSKVKTTELKGNLIDDIDDTMFQDDPDLNLRRLLIWDYEAFYIDTDDEENCQIVYDRLQNGEDLVLNDKNQIIPRSELNINTNQNKTKQQSSETVFTLEDLMESNSANDIDQFNTIAQNKASFESKFNFSSGMKNFHTNERSVASVSKELGYDDEFIPKSNDSRSLLILEKLKLQRQRRHLQMTGGHIDGDNGDDYGDDYDYNNDTNRSRNYQDEYETSGDNRDRERNYEYQ